MTPTLLTPDTPLAEEALSLALDANPVEAFFQRIRARQLHVAIVGMGYVGLPLALCFAKYGLHAVGIDVDEEKITALNEGKSYIQHINTEHVAKAVKNKRLMATNDFSAVSHCQAVVICVPTPLTRHLDPDLQYIEKTCEAIAPHLQPYTLVSLESTTWPGTTEEVMIPLLEKGSGLKSGENLFIAFSPEREDPGNRQYQTRNIPKLVGANDADSLKIALALYRTAVEEVVPVEHLKVAEAAKLLENIFRSVNIALVNELKVIFDKMGINVWDVIRSAATKPFGFMPFWPGPGLGGHCIPIDPFYLSWKAKEYGVRTRFIELSGEVNRMMPRWVMGKVQDCLNEFSKPLKGSKILILGLSYKPNVSDMRESPSLELIELLQEKGAHVEYHDPFICEIPPNREHEKLVGKQSQCPSSDYDCFLLTTDHDTYHPETLLNYGVPVVDTRNLFPSKHPLVFPA